ALADSEDELLLEQETWNNIRYSYNHQEESIDEEKLGSFTQYPIRLAWAITIHKSQGLTFQNAIIDAGDSFAPGQVYVALSRCTSLDGLIVRSNILPSSISTDPLVISFARKEAGETELTRLLEREKLEFQHLQLTKTFDLQKLSDSIGNYVQYLQGKQLPDIEQAVSNARDMLRHAVELQNVALKFQQQMKTLLRDEQDDKLRERVSKAIEYFSKSLTEQVLDLLENHIVSLKGVKKTKQYLKYVRQLRNAIARQINSIQKVKYGGQAFNPSAVELSIANVNVPERGKAAEKGSSLRETLTMLKTGMKPFDIAEKRGLAVGTIETHMALLIKSGDIDIRECMEETKIKSILVVIKEIQAVSIQPVKQKLGDDFTYGEIRAVMNHLQVLEK
ncbi:MAG TPA: helix-turn-helix domain-containing protein, partial [Chryseosolibacter sp.]